MLYGNCVRSLLLIYTISTEQCWIQPGFCAFPNKLPWHVEKRVVFFGIYFTCSALNTIAVRKSNTQKHHSHDVGQAINPDLDLLFHKRINSDDHSGWMAMPPHFVWKRNDRPRCGETPTACISCCVCVCVC